VEVLHEVLLDHRSAALRQFLVELHPDLGQDGGVGVAFMQLPFTGDTAAPQSLAGELSTAAPA
jgi:hypothetical protein